MNGKIISTSEMYTEMKVLCWIHYKIGVAKGMRTIQNV